MKAEFNTSIYYIVLCYIEKVEGTVIYRNTNWLVLTSI